MFIDPDLRAMIAARFEFVGTEITGCMPTHLARHHLDETPWTDAPSHRCPAATVVGVRGGRT